MMGGMFVSAWTSYFSNPWIAPAIGLAMVGAGSTCVVVSIANYLVDTNLGFQWASSLLGFISLVLAFAPVAVLIWEKEIRARSPFMKEAAEDRRKSSVTSV